MDKQTLKIIVTGATGMVGEGVLLECLNNPKVSHILSVSRKPSGLQHPKLKEILVADFMQLTDDEKQLAGYDACFYCMGISSLGLDEKTYTHITYDTTLHFAGILNKLNPGLVFNFVSGKHTDSSEQGKVMWARVKGKTENALSRMFPNRQHNFRPGIMKPLKEQKNLKGYNRYVRILYPILSPFYPSCSIQAIGKAMINVSLKGHTGNILEVSDIKALAKLLPHN